MQLFSADATISLKRLKIIFAHENMKKMPSKVPHNRPKKCFQYCQPAQNQSKSQLLFHKNCSPRDLCVMTLLDDYACKKSYNCALGSRAPK